MHKPKTAKSPAPAGNIRTANRKRAAARASRPDANRTKAADDAATTALAATNTKKNEASDRHTSRRMYSLIASPAAVRPVRARGVSGEFFVPARPAAAHPAGPWRPPDRKSAFRSNEPRPQAGSPPSTPPA